MFDNGGPPSALRRSRGNSCLIDPAADTAGVVATVTIPTPIFAETQGDLAAAPRRQLVDRLGQRQRILRGQRRRHAALRGAHAGGVAELPHAALRLSARPATRPALTLTRAPGAALRAYLSWNGATTVARWRLEAGASRAEARTVAEAASMLGDLALPPRTWPPRRRRRRPRARELLTLPAPLGRAVRPGAGGRSARSSVRPPFDCQRARGSPATDERMLTLDGRGTPPRGGKMKRSVRVALGVVLVALAVPTMALATHHRSFRHHGHHHHGRYAHSGSTGSTGSSGGTGATGAAGTVTCTARASRRCRERRRHNHRQRHRSHPVRLRPKRHSDGSEYCCRDTPRHAGNGATGGPERPVAPRPGQPGPAALPAASAPAPPAAVGTVATTTTTATATATATATVTARSPTATAMTTARRRRRRATAGR